MPYTSVKRGWKAEEQGGSGPPVHTEVKKTKSLLPGAEPDEGRGVWSIVNRQGGASKGLGQLHVRQPQGTSRCWGPVVS